MTNEQKDQTDSSFFRHAGSRAYPNRLLYQ